MLMYIYSLNADCVMNTEMVKKKCFVQGTSKLALLFYIFYGPMDKSLHNIFKSSAEKPLK